MLCSDLVCCDVLWCGTVDRVQCGGKVVSCMIELSVVDGWFV